MVKICQQFRSDMIQLNNLLKLLKADVSAMTSPNSPNSLFGIFPNSDSSNISELHSNYKDLAAKYEQLNATIQSFANDGDKQPE